MNIVITGASRGIGKAVLDKFSKEGANICFAYKTPKTIKQNNKKIKGFCADLSIQSEAELFSNFVKKHFNHLDVLVNNVGIFIPASAKDGKPEDLDTLLRNNLFSAIYVTQSLLPLLQKSNQCSRIVNINSVAGLMAYPPVGAFYSISKFAMKGFSVNLREELKHDNIKVSEIYPGAVYTDSWKDSGLSEDVFMKPEDIADTIWSLSQLSDRANFDEIVLRNDPSIT